MGSVLGLMGGVVVGALSGKAEGIIVGAVAGAVAGGMIGSVYFEHSRIEEDNKRLYAYLESIDGNISGMDVVTAAATSSLQCYDREFNMLVAAMREKKIDREAAAKRFAEISSGREEAINILGEISKYGRDLNQEYAEAMQKEENIVVNPKKPQAKYASNSDYQKYNSRCQKRAENTAAIQRVRDKSETLVQKADSISRIQEAAQAESAKQTDEIQKIMNDLADIRA